MLRMAAGACLVVGVVLRTVQYLAQVSLWLDELAVAHNVVARGLIRLVTEPLAYQQVAPAGFLALQKGSTTILGAGELGFRFVPWLAAVSALFVFWRLVVRLLPPGPGVIALAVFAASPALTWFGSQAKQYSTDVLAVLLLIWSGCELLRPRPRTAMAVSAGALALLVSIPAVPIGAAIGALLLWTTVRSGAPRWPVLLIAGAAWTAAALLTAGLARFTLSSDTATYMQEFWARGFPPTPWTSLETLLWVPRALTNTLGFALFWFVASEERLFGAMTWMLALAAVPGAW